MVDKVPIYIILDATDFISFFILKMNNYQAIIFDLGNVIFKFSFENTFNYWAKILNLEPNEVSQRFEFNGAFKQFEKNEITPNQFMKHVSNKLGFELTEEQFEKGWNSIYEEMVPGILNTLIALRINYKLVALTNTNVIHSKVWKIKYAEALNFFEKIFCSHEIKVRKPEHKAYEIVLKYLNIGPKRIVYLDDNYDCVKSASEMGIKSLTVSSHDKMIHDLKKIGIKIE